MPVTAYPNPILTGSEISFVYAAREHKLHSARLDPTSKDGEASRDFFYLITDGGATHLLRYSFFLGELHLRNPLDHVKNTLEAFNKGGRITLNNILTRFYEKHPQS
jgi:hypothetical protein